MAPHLCCVSMIELSGMPPDESEARALGRSCSSSRHTRNGMRTSLNAAGSTCDDASMMRCSSWAPMSSIPDVEQWLNTSAMSSPDTLVSPGAAA